MKDLENRIEQADLEGDEEVIEALHGHLVNNFPRLEFRKKVPLKELFSEPDSRWLRSIWGYGHGDIAVYRHGKLICIIEPGGSYHLREEAQKLRDRKKDKICKVNSVKCLRVVNDFVNHLDKKQARKLLKKHFYGVVR